jgi:hypothetical protein
MHHKARATYYKNYIGLKPRITGTEWYRCTKAYTPLKRLIGTRQLDNSHLPELHRATQATRGPRLLKIELGSQVGQATPNQSNKPVTAQNQQNNIPVIERDKGLG